MSTLIFRKANAADLSVIVEMLADDQLGQSREIVSDPLDQRYIAAFDAIDQDPNQLLAVAVEAEKVIGCMQVTFIAGLSRMGMRRGQIEAVRIASRHRGPGVGLKFFDWAFEQCRQRECKLVQLTSDKTRQDAIRFYEKLGFKASHEGMKLEII